MDESKKPGPLPIHPALERIEPGARRLVGYIGPASGSTGMVRLYPSLDNLDEYHEFKQSDVLHHERAHGAQEGGASVWLRPDAELTTHQVTRQRVSDLPRPRKVLRLNRETIRTMNQPMGVRALSNGCTEISGPMCTVGAGDCSDPACDSEGCTGSLPGC